MKTVSTQTLQFSGYPLQPVAADRPETLALRIVSNERNSDYLFSVKAKSLADVPEDWDESWFANYE